MIAVFLANGYEEIEALAVVDVLRRAGLDVQMIGVGSDAPVGAHGISVAVDANETDIDASALDAVVLPGGMPGTLNLEKSAVVQAAVSSAMERGAVVAAICAAPSILDHAGYLAPFAPHPLCWGSADCLRASVPPAIPVLSPRRTALRWMLPWLPMAT